MSDFHVETFRIGRINPHPNADTLGEILVRGYPAHIKIGPEQNLYEGDLAVYIPEGSIVPDVPMFSFLKDRHIRALRLRGRFSMGLVVPAPPGCTEGQDVAELLGVVRAEPKDPVDEGAETDLSGVPRYTDIEPLRRWPDIIPIGTEVVITEKLHGQSLRARHTGERLWVGSFEVMRRFDPEHPHWIAVIQAGLEEKLRIISDYGLYGEVVGTQKRYGYGHDKAKPKLFAFDLMDLNQRRYLDYDEEQAVLKRLDIPPVPLLYRGPWDPQIAYRLTEGKSTISDQNIREGVVVRTAKESWDPSVQRVVLKLHSEAFLLGKR